MIIFIILTIIVICGIGVIACLLKPEIYYKHFSAFHFPWTRLKLTQDVTENKILEKFSIKNLSIPNNIKANHLTNDFIVPLEENTQRLEVLLEEKNKIISQLQKNLESERFHRQEFEKVKSIMDEEFMQSKVIHRNQKVEK